MKASKIFGFNTVFAWPGFIVLCLALFVLLRMYFGSTIILHAQAPDYGDIKLEIRHGSNIIEQRHFLVNPSHRVYVQTINSDPFSSQLRFYFDRRHQTFASKGIFIIGDNLTVHWVSPYSMINQASVHHVASTGKTKVTALFEGFADSAFVEINATESGIAKYILPLILIITLALLIQTCAIKISNTIFASRFLNPHKLKFLILIYLILVLSSLNPALKFLIAIISIYCLCHYFLVNEAVKTHTWQNLIGAILLATLFVGFAAQGNLLKRLGTEIQEQGYQIDFSFFEQLGGRFSEFFTFKKEIGHLNSVLKVDVFGSSPTTKVIVGKQGTMFEGTGERRIEGENIGFFDNISDYLGRLPFQQSELEQWESVIAQRNCWLNNQGIDYLFAIAPTKALIYPELLPQVLADIKSRNPNSPRIQQLDNHLKNNRNFSYLNLTQPLLEAKKLQDYPKLFYRTDFHWNYLGAFYAYKAIIEQLTLTSDYNLSAISLDKFELDINPQWAHSGFLGLLGLLPHWYNNEHYIRLMPIADNPMKQIAPYNEQGVFDIQIPEKLLSTISGKEFRVEYIENPGARVKKILVIGDSFIQKVFPLISAHASENYFSRAVFHFPDELIELIKPDIVIQEILNMYLLRKPPINPKAVKNSQCD